MKNTVKLFRIIALVAVIGFSMVACEPENTTKDNELREVSTVGQLTVTGLTAYEGKEISASASFTHNLYAYEHYYNVYNPNIGEIQENEAVNAKITGGQAVMKVFKGSPTSFLESYNGNDQDVLFSVYIHVNDNDGIGGTVTANFTNGIASGAFVVPTNP